jgi:hypothetical protein
MILVWGVIHNSLLHGGNISNRGSIKYSNRLIPLVLVAQKRPLDVCCPGSLSQQKLIKNRWLAFEACSWPVAQCIGVVSPWIFFSEFPTPKHCPCSEMRSCQLPFTFGFQWPPHTQGFTINMPFFIPGYFTFWRGVRCLKGFYFHSFHGSIFSGGCFGRDGNSHLFPIWKKLWIFVLSSSIQF